MVDPATTRRWSNRALFIGLSAIIIFLHLLPLQTQPSRWAAPDLLVCLAAAWVLRRPDYVPALSIVAVFFVADVFFMRPLGLMTALIVLATEFLRSRSHLMQEFPFALEWAVVATVIASVMIGYRLVLMIAVVEPPAFGLTMLQFVATTLAYPLVVLVSKFAFGIVRLAPGDLDRQRLKV
ncbi:rod shape-determining protein MreD [Aliiroseovarius sp. YM-037]|uniref:rod shape-determining protein MreD n=1 Tax=Aliiroseovarius sp. YM-037 TaxID=3341728 RepID=UPI003A807D6A